MLLTRRGNFQFPYSPTCLLLENVPGIPHVHILFLSNPTSMPPPSDSYTPESFCLDIPACNLLTSIKGVMVFTRETSGDLGQPNTLPTGNLKTDIALAKSHGKKLSSSLSAQSSIAVGNTTLSQTSQLGTPELFLSHHCLSHSPHPGCYQLLPLFYFYFLPTFPESTPFLFVLIVVLFV